MLNMSNTPTQKEKTAVGTCYKCHQSAKWNTPALDEGNNLWCDGCVDSDRSGIMFRSVDQFMEDGFYVFTGGVVLNGIVVWKDKHTWTEGGSRAVHLTKEEKEMDVEEIAEMLNKEHNIDGLTRCTGCGIKMTQDQIAGYPLFAGVVCAPCNEKHKEHLNEERRRGHVCRMCGQPYGNCCC